jgi:flagella basal body P-ring formation protein FlgA
MALYRAKRRIPAGSVIRIEDGLMPDLVVRGRSVAVTVRNGALTLRARGVARQSGALGAMVEVLNPDSKRTFKAVVTGLNQVEVKL